VADGPQQLVAGGGVAGAQAVHPVVELEGVYGRVTHGRNSRRRRFLAQRRGFLVGCRGFPNTPSHPRAKGIFPNCCGVCPSAYTRWVESRRERVQSLWFTLKSDTLMALRGMAPLFERDHKLRRSPWDR